MSHVINVQVFSVLKDRGPKKKPTRGFQIVVTLDNEDRFGMIIRQSIPPRAAARKLRQLADLLEKAHP